MPLLAFLRPLKCVCRVVTAFFMLTFLIFPAAAETAPPPISGSNGLMGLWGANSSAPQTGSSGKPISGSHEQQGATAPGTPTESSPPSADSQDAEIESSILTAPRNAVAPPIFGSNGLMGEWGANSSQPQRGSNGKPISGSNSPTVPGIPTESSPPSADAKSSPQDAELKSSPPDAELESNPTTAPRNVAPSSSAQSDSNELIEWSANSSELQTGSSGKPISGSNDQQGVTAPGILTESSRPRATLDADLKSSPPDEELESSPPSAAQNVAPSPSAQSGSNGLIEWDANSSAQPMGSSTDRSVAPSPTAQSGFEGSMGEWGTSGSTAQTDASANASGKAFKVPNGQHANLESDIVAPETQTELNPSSAPPEQNLEATTPPASKVLVIIDKPTQKMKVFVDDAELYSWKVSSGLPGYATPSGTYAASSMNEIWYSKEWDDAPMPHAIFFTKKGHAIHGTEETKKLGRPASHGCVRLAPEDARTLFALVKEKGLENTEIVLNGETPGGDSRVAKTSPRKQQVNRAKTRVYAAPSRRFGRGGWSQRRFSGRPPQRYWRW
jgi:lipoprotein-anchoring transpeptidase ErfK/SrfK